MASPCVGDIVAAVGEIIHAEIDPKAVVHEGSELLADLRLDSLTLMTLVVGLEDRFRVTLTEEDSEGIRTVGELAALVARKAAA